MKRASDSVALALVPVAILLGVSAGRIMLGADSTSRGVVVTMCGAGMLILSVLVLAGLRFYMRRPALGLLTAICLMALLPISWNASHAGVWPALVVGFSGVTGGLATLLFMWLCLEAMWKESVSAD